MNMGQRIKKARLERRFKQEYVAEALGVSRQAVSKWETGQSQPDTKNLIALSQLLGVSVEALTIGDAAAAPVPSSKARLLRAASLILLAVSSLLWCIGFFSGEYSTMLFVPISNAMRIGIPLIWYGTSAAAISIKAGQIGFLLLAILVRTVAWGIHNDKQALD